MHILLFVAISTAAVLASDLEPQARLLVSKNVENDLLVEGRDLTIKYDVYNVGSSTAFNIALQDDSFPLTDFEVVRGQLSVSWKSLPPNSNVSHVVILKPLKSGTFNFTSAGVKYQPTEEADVQVALTTMPGEGPIMSNIEFSRKHSPHLLEWSIFAAMCTPSLLIPFLLWWKSHSKYAGSNGKKKQ